MSTTTKNVVKFSEWVDLEHRFYDERIFHEVLRIERKRSERSGRPFLLLLMDISKIAHNRNGIATFKKIVSQLNKHTRETDIKGWYVHKSVIGIILTEVGEHDREFIVKRISQRVRNSLFFVLESQFFNEMKISLQWFPDKSGDAERTYVPNLIFYPEMVEEAIHKVFSLYVKRFIDIIGSIVGLLVFAPFFLLIPIMIKLTSRGPVFFKQERLGQFGKKFTFFKFRSMRVENDDVIHREYIRNLIHNEWKKGEKNDPINQNSVYKIQDDPRVTFIGKFLRKTSLDELPQFINVLKGEMSLVGPRPPIPYECDGYKLWHMRRVIEVKPGITGLWQVEGRSSTNFDDMVRLDLKYIREWSLWLDFKILIKTPWAVISCKGAY